VDADTPIKDEKDLDKLASASETDTEGFFPIGKNRFWHGGLHLRTLKPVVAVRDGTLIAYRIDKQLQTVDLPDGKYEFSAGFALLHHETKRFATGSADPWKLAVDKPEEAMRLPADATPAQQDAAAAELYRRWGTRPWAESAACWR